MRGDWSPEDRTGRGDSRDGAGRVGYAFDFHGPPMRCGVYLMKLIQSMLQRAETIFFLTSWMVGRHIPSSGGNCLPRLLKTLSAFPICDFTLIWIGILYIPLNICTQFSYLEMDFQSLGFSEVFFFHLEIYLKIEGNED